MKPKILSLVALLVVGLMVSSIGHAKIGQFPHVPLVAVKEIDPNWVTISIVAGIRRDDGTVEFWDTKEHPAQANALATFVCNLYNRKAVMLSLFGGPLTHNIHGNPTNAPYLILKNSYYLFACAIE